MPRVRNEGYLAFVRTRPCCACGITGRSQAAHIRMGSRSLGKEPTGMGQKPDDRFALPLCGPVIGIAEGCHARQHSGSEAAFWKALDKDPFVIAGWLFALYTAGSLAVAVEGPAPRKPRKAKPGKKTHRRPPPRQQRVRWQWPKRKLPTGRKFSK
jgi:hypothetical protein